MVDGVPAIPLDLAQRLNRYTEFRSAAAWDWHPTRRAMLIGTRFADATQAHAVAAPGADRRQLTFFPDRVLGARYEPAGGGRYLVVLKDVGGDEFFQSYRVDLETGDITLITDGKSRNSAGVFSTDGRRIAYGSTRRNGRDIDIFVAEPARAGSERMVAQLTGNGWGVEDWSPDDSRLLLMNGISVNESYLSLLDLTTGERVELTPREGRDTVAYGAAEFAPDGRGIYATTDRGSEFQRLAYLDLGTRRWRTVTPELPWDVDAFDVAPDGRTIALVTNEDGVGVMRFVDAASGRVTPGPALPKGVVSGVRWRPDSREVAFSLASARTPSDVYSYEPATRKLERWTFSETAGLNAERFVEPELVKWTSFDGRQISGFLYKPPARFTGKRPVIVSIHGGPEGQSRPGFIGASNYYLNEAGAAVIYPNIRGSTGYGKSYAKADNRQLREGAYKDIAALFDWIATRPDLDATRIMVTGGSYGGHMVLAVASMFPERISAAVDVVGISSLTTFLQNTSPYRQDLRRAEYGDERDPAMRAWFERTAPLNNAERITKPLLVVQGGNDPRVPRTESLQIVERVRRRGTPVWYLEAKDEGHGFAKKGNQA
ncbi:MAG TPA: S9 family peptidase, partial [Gemmatimonadaceae bacterium]|nr:S9 family peptidase [Gemmatimonadaceae bacterium]